MQEHELTFIRDAYSWPKSETSIHLLQHGENDTYVVDTSCGKFIVRRYRQDRYSVDEIRAELEWINELAQFLTVPSVLTNTYNDSVSRLVSANEELLYVAFRFVGGSVIENPTSSDYHQLGRLMSSIHAAADSVVNQATIEWQGWNRPKYDLTRTVEMPLCSLLEFSPLSADDRERCTNIAGELRKNFHLLGSDERFIHGDLHFGNILAMPDKWCCLDFDECGFGHRAIDIGVVRLHLKNKELFEDHWLSFASGYGVEFSGEEISLGTAIRIFYMAGKIPNRLDIDDLKNRPDAQIRKYLGWIESEIF